MTKEKQLEKEQGWIGYTYEMGSHMTISPNILGGRHMPHATIIDTYLYNWKKDTEYIHLELIIAKASTTFF